MEKLKNIIVHFIKNFPRPLTRTELVKLIYLFEYYVVQTFGEQYSEVHFKRDYYGPNDMTIIEEIEYLDGIGVIIMKKELNCSGEYMYSHFPGNRALMDKYVLPIKYAYIADSLIDLTYSWTVNEIKQYAYSTPPMKEILEKEQENGNVDYGRPLNMGKSDFQPRKFTKEELKAARERRKLEPNRGSDEEYYNHLMEQYKKYEDLRRNAEKCIVK